MSTSEISQVDLECGGGGDGVEEEEDETWFKIKGNKTCEICNSIARNIVGPNSTEGAQQTNETNAVETNTSSTPASPSTDSRSCLNADYAEPEWAVPELEDHALDTSGLGIRLARIPGPLVLRARSSSSDKLSREICDESCLPGGNGLKHELRDGDCSPLYIELGFKPCDYGSFRGFERGSLALNTELLNNGYFLICRYTLYFHFSKRFQSKSSKPSLEYFPASPLAAESLVNLTYARQAQYLYPISIHNVDQYMACQMGVKPYICLETNFYLLRAIESPRHYVSFVVTLNSSALDSGPCP
ncbi:unnamed protein product [Fraxinus pennsylvanica]|uniref:Uncharacterized protein n=1 Tax=Fraxinus pennsylvanica TaxID=56036 RepID=A0AAD2DWW5_9LAMI|nr:unnamed protein product [Fraxinus pennsylvanica]